MTTRIRLLLQASIRSELKGLIFMMNYERYSNEEGAKFAQS